MIARLGLLLALVALGCGSSGSPPEPPRATTPEQGACIRECQGIFTDCTAPPTSDQKVARCNELLEDCYATCTGGS